MKFVALALALLLAVGSHAASLEIDPPTQLAHMRAAVRMYLDQVKQSCSKSLVYLDGTDYEQYKVQLSNSLDNLHSTLLNAQGEAAPYTDAFVRQMTEVTKDVRTTIMADVDALSAAVAPQREALKTVVDKHIEEYRKLIDPVIVEYSNAHRAQMENLKTTIDPMMEQLSIAVAKNVEETKTALMPLVETVRAKLNERLEGLKNLASPYVEEYKEQITKALTDAKEVASTLDIGEIKEKVRPQMEAIQEKASPLIEEIKGQLTQFYVSMAAAMAKS
ncbi:unnamed protein product [Merluccius merluccius]